MLALTLVPAGIWTAPTYDRIYRGFDANLTTSTGSVDIGPDAASAKSSAGSISTINLATTLRRRLAASIQATVVSNDGALEPLRIGVWSPWTRTGYFVAFGPAPNNEVNIENVIGGDAGPTLLGGTMVSQVLGQYQLNRPYSVTFLADRAQGVIRAAVNGPGVVGTKSLTPSQSPDLFANVQISLTASTSAGPGMNDIVLRNYSLMLPHERVWTAVVSDPVVKGLTIGLAVLGTLALLAIWFTKRQRPSLGSKRRCSFRLTWIGLLAASLYLVGNFALFRFGGHPFDFGNEQLYAYIAKVYGPSQLYFLPDITSLAGAWSGTPWLQASFPYQPLIAYLDTGIGWGASVLTPGGGALTSAGQQLSILIKSVNVAFGLADGVLIYLILQEFEVGARWSRLGAIFFLFNPAVWFSVSVWGQTHVFSIFFVLLAALFAQRRLPSWAWLALFAACLTRPQIAAFGLLIGIAFLKMFTLRESVVGLSRAVIVAFIVLTPLTLTTSPSLPIDINLYAFHNQEGGGNQASLATVSQSAYSVWPLITYLFHGATGIGRAYTQSGQLLVGTITYQQAGVIFTALAMLAVSSALLLRKPSAADPGRYLPLVAVGVASFFMLLTGIVATSFLLVLPLLLLCRRWMDPIAYCFVAAIWTISTFVPMYGDMGAVISGYTYPLLAPAYNPVTRFFVELYSWDRFITVAIVANICAIIWVAVLAYRGPTSTPHVVTEAATA